MMAKASDKSMEKPGDVIIEDIILKSYNGFEMSLKGLFQSMTIYEDIFANYMSGSIVIIDSLNMAKNFPIIGAETLQITYYTPNYLDQAKDHTPITLNFRTYKVSQYVETAQETATMLRLEFMSEQGIKSMQAKVSKAYTNMTISNMVVNIYDEYLASDNTDYSGVVSAAVQGFGAGLLSPFPGSAIAGAAAAGSYAYVNREDKIPMRTVTETFDTRSYVIPYWSPLYAINWLCHRSRELIDTRICDFVFFENSDGFHFAPITNLKKKGKVAGDYHVYTNYPEGFRSDESERMMVSEMRNVLSAKTQDYSDKVRQQALGMLASSIFTHDITTKRWSYDTFNYDDQFDPTMTVEKNPLVPRGQNNYATAAQSHMKMYPNSTFTVKNGSTIHDPNETVLYRQSMLNQINSINLVVEAWGDTNVKAGDVIKYSIPSKENNKKLDKWEDDYVTGFYLVTAIRHLITTDRHTMTITMSRDSYSEPLADKKKAELQLEDS